MRVTKPVDVTMEQRLVSSSIQEPDIQSGETVWEFRPAPDPYEFSITAGQDVRVNSLVGMCVNTATDELLMLAVPDDGTVYKKIAIYEASTGYRKGFSSLEVRSKNAITTRNTENGDADGQNIFFVGAAITLPGEMYFRIDRYINGVPSTISTAPKQQSFHHDFTCAEVGGEYSYYIIATNNLDGGARYIIKANYNTGAEEAFIKLGVGPDGLYPTNINKIDYYNGEFYFIKNHYGNCAVWRYTSSFVFIDVVHIFDDTEAWFTSICNDGAAFYFANVWQTNKWQKGEIRTFDVTTFDRVLVTPPPDIDPYQAGDRVILLDTHKLYEATAENRDNPSVGVDLVPPTWVEVSSSNRYRAFDESITSVATGETPLTFEIKPGEVFDSFVALNVAGASSALVTVTDPEDGLIYEREVSLVDNSTIADWYSYLWNGFSYKSDFALFDLPLYSSATAHVSFFGDGLISVGALVTGPSIVLGQAVHGTSIQQLDFSTVDEDDFGNIKITKRPGAKLVNYDVSTQKSQLNYVYRELEKLSGVATVWSGTDNIQDETLVYGYHRDNNITLDTPTLCQVTIQVRGLI